MSYNDPGGGLGGGFGELLLMLLWRLFGKSAEGARARSDQHGIQRNGKAAGQRNPQDREPQD